MECPKSDTLFIYEQLIIAVSEKTLKFSLKMEESLKKTLKFFKKVKVFFEKFLKLFNKRYRELMESFYL